MARAVAFTKPSRDEAKRFAEATAFVSERSDTFRAAAVAAVESAAARLPVGVLRLLAANGLKIGVLRPGETYVQASRSVAEVAEKHPRIAASLANVAAMYVIPEKTVLVQDVADGIFTHELGHALDAALAREANSPEIYICRSGIGAGTMFEAFVYDKPVSNYGGSNVEEFFAESFRGVVGVNLADFTFPPITPEYVAQTAPRAAAFFQKTFARLERDYPEIAVAPAREAGREDVDRSDKPLSEIPRSSAAPVFSALTEKPNAGSGKRDLRQEITDRVIAQLEQGTIPWEKPWEFVRPLNGATQKSYRGINTLHLMMTARERGYDDPRWMTFKQAQSLGFQVRRGETAASIEYWKPPDIEREYQRYRQTRPDDSKSLADFAREKGGRLRWTPFYAAVFNATQIDAPVLDRDGKEQNEIGADGAAARVMRPLPEARPLDRPNREPFVALEAAQTILTNSGATIRNDGADRAYYQPSTDAIHLPKPELFKNNAAYYSVALHELGHWTGHPSRLNRDYFKNPDGFGGVQYAKEELRAELASVFLSAEIGIEYDVQNHSAYIGSWLQTLREDKNELMRAAADAERIADFVYSFSREHVREQALEESLTIDREGESSALVASFLERSGTAGGRAQRTTPDVTAAVIPFASDPEDYSGDPEEVSKLNAHILRNALQDALYNAVSRIAPTRAPIFEVARAVDRVMAEGGCSEDQRAAVTQSLRLVPRELVTVGAASAAAGSPEDLTTLVVRALPEDVRAAFGASEPPAPIESAIRVEDARALLQTSIADIMKGFERSDALDRTALLYKAALAQTRIADAALATLPSDAAVHVTLENDLGPIGVVGVVDGALSSVAYEVYAALRDAATHSAILNEIRDAGHSSLSAYRADDDAFSIAVDVKACYSPGFEGSAAASTGDWNKAAYLFRNHAGSEALDSVIIASLKASPHVDLSDENLQRLVRHDVRASLGDVFASKFANDLATSLIDAAALARSDAAARAPRSAAAIVDATLNQPASLSHPTPRLAGLRDNASSRLHTLVEQMLESATPVSPATVAFEIRSQLGILPLVSTPLGTATLQNPEFHTTMASLDGAPQAVIYPNKPAAMIVALDEAPAQDARLAIESIVAVPAFEDRGYEAGLLDAVCSYADQQNMEIVVRAGAVASKYEALLLEYGFRPQADGPLVRGKREPQALSLRAERGTDGLYESSRRDAIGASAIAILSASDHERVQAALGKGAAEERTLVGAEHGL